MTQTRQFPNQQARPFSSAETEISGAMPHHDCGMFDHMISGASELSRWMLALVVAALFVVAVPVAFDNQAGLVAVGASVAVLLLSAFAMERSRDLLLLVVVGNSGPSSDERCLRGSFRRQTNPDTDGRPRPRAPGSGLRPA